MQWFKSAMVVSSAVFVAALAAGTNGCSSSKGNGDGGTDAKSDSPIKPPPGDGGGDTGPTGTCPQSDPACEVCDVTGFTPQAQGTPIGPKAGKCASADITAFVTACLGANATSTTCNTWQTSENTSAPNCLNCVFTQQTAAQWGVLDCTSTGCGLNVPGCLDLALGQQSMENSTSNGSCGDYLSASYGCQDAACSSCTTADFSTCTNDAVSAECKTYADAFQNATPCQVLNSDNPPAAVNTCFPSGSSGFTDQEYADFTNFFCGQ